QAPRLQSGGRRPPLDTPASRPPKREPLQFCFVLCLQILRVTRIRPVRITTRPDGVGLVHHLAVPLPGFASVSPVSAEPAGESIPRNHDIPIPILSLAGGLILFLVALLNVLQQFAPPTAPVANPQPLTTAMAISPLAFPNIITPYGIAAVIVIPALCTDSQ